MAKTSLKKPAGFTLVELLTSVAVVTGLFALLAPAILSARAASRATVCQGHLRQVSLALQGRLATHRQFPAGGSVGPYNTSGVSWIVEVLPHLGESALYDKFDATGPHSGFLPFHPENLRLLDRLVIPTLRCPASELSPLWPVGSTAATVMMPSYVGIAGASGHNGFPEPRVSPCCVPRIEGQISAGGLLPPNQAVRPQCVTDGMAKTLVVGEASAPMYLPGAPPYRTDGAFPMGWATGTSVPGAPPGYAAPFPTWNVTTLRYRLNERDYSLPGVDNRGGPNNPLLSTHPGKVGVVLADGSARFLADSLDLDVLKQLATRDDSLRLGAGQRD